MKEGDGELREGEEDRRKVEIEKVGHTEISGYKGFNGCLYRVKLFRHMP